MIVKTLQDVLEPMCKVAGMEYDPLINYISIEAEEGKPVRIKIEKNVQGGFAKDELEQLMGACDEQ